VLNEAESETEAKATTVDPVDDPSARRCCVCEKPLARPQQRYCAGPCARIVKTSKQKYRRWRSRGGAY
jgi:hypothetical protein